MLDSNSTPVRAEDVLPTGSRVNWGPVFAGAAIALALYFLLALIGAAVGVSVGGRASAAAVGWGAAAWAILTTVAALFVGGWVTSQLSVGENRTEAAMHGIILWAVLFAMLLWLVAAGVRSGFTAMVGMAHAGGEAAQGTDQEDWAAAARRAGVPQAKIDDWRRTAEDAPEALKRRLEDPDTQRAVADAVTRVTWLTVLGTVLSMAAAVAGSLVGNGATLRLAMPGWRPRRPAPDRRHHVNV